MTCGIIIQCHDKSTRLPKKLFKVLGDMNVMEHMVATCCMSIADIVIIATSTAVENDTIIKEYERIKERYPKLRIYKYFGEDKNVLARYFNAASEYKLDTIVRITSDCPMHSNSIINLAVKTFVYTKCDYLSFFAIDGMDTEVMSFKALEEAYNNATEDYEKEHVTVWIREKSSLKKQKLEEVKISLDTQEDLDRIKEIYECQAK